MGILIYLIGDDMKPIPPRGLKAGNWQKVIQNVHLQVSIPTKIKKEFPHETI